MLRSPHKPERAQCVGHGAEFKAALQVFLTAQPLDTDAASPERAHGIPDTGQRANAATAPSVPAQRLDTAPARQPRRPAGAGWTGERRTAAGRHPCKRAQGGEGWSKIRNIGEPGTGAGPRLFVRRNLGGGVNSRERQQMEMRRVCWDRPFHVNNRHSGFPLTDTSAKSLDCDKAQAETQLAGRISLGGTHEYNPDFSQALDEIGPARRSPWWRSSALAWHRL